ncbi:MAG: efflux RND transporter periplasmic adaptor subunit [Methyloligellaceae bacterium]
MKRSISIGFQSIFVLAIIGFISLYAYSPKIVAEYIPGLKTEKSADKKKRRGDRKAPVIVESVTETSNDNIIEAIGDGRAIRFVTLYTNTAGEITEFPVKPADHVKKDDIILRLNSQKAELGVKVARTKLLEAQRKAERARQLKKQNVTSQANVDDADTILARAQLELDQATEALSDRVLRAPFSGILGIPKVEVGDRVETNSEIVTLDDRTSLTVEFHIPEHFHSRIKPGLKVKASTPSVADSHFTGSVSSIDSRIEAASRSVKVRATIPNKGDKLRPGMSFAVEIIIPGETRATIPELALQWGKGESYVWRINDGKAQRVIVKMVRRISSNILIEGDIKKGDLIVIEGVQRLRPGIQVEFKNQSSNTGQAVSRREVGNGS